MNNLYPTNLLDDRRSSLFHLPMIICSVRDLCPTPERAMLSSELSTRISTRPKIEYPIASRTVKRILDKVIELQESTDEYECQIFSKLILETFGGKLMTVGKNHVKYWFQRF